MKAAKLEIGVRSQEPGEKSKKEEGRSQKKCFYKYEMLPRTLPLQSYNLALGGRYCTKNWLSPHRATDSQSESKSAFPITNHS